MTITLDSNQQAAVDFAIGRRFSVITGGAGTGKTTLIKAIADELASYGEKVHLAAFAGKAAARMREATGRYASTIHRMLMYQGDRFALRDLRGVNVVIDEASMLRSDLLAEIVRRRPRRLILVGDQAQLPPVGPGQPFHDLIAICPGAVHTLTTCYRATEAVYRAASAIRAGQMPRAREHTAQERWEMCQTGGPKPTHDFILDMVRRGELDFEKDIILSPRNDDEASGAAAVTPLNRDIVELVNPHAEGEKLKPGDRVINTKNTPELDIWNGSTGTVHSIDARGRMHLRMDFPCFPEGALAETCDVEVPRDKLINFRLAYALSVHKSQGSQYRKVVFVVLGRDSFNLLERSMVYTAVTRAREECLVVGEMGVFGDAIRKINYRSTVMQLLAEIYGG